MNAFLALVRRDCRLCWRRGGGAGLGVLFALLMTALLPLSLGPDPAKLQSVAPAYLWLAVLLSILLTLDRLFHDDEAAGGLDILRLNMSAFAIVTAKTLAHWLMNAVPLILATPLLAVLLNLDRSHLGLLLVSLVAGTPALTTLGALGAALTLHVRRGGLLLPLLVLPLCVPVLIFGCLALAADKPRGALLALSGLSLAITAFTPLATASALSAVRA